MFFFFVIQVSNTESESRLIKNTDFRLLSALEKIVTELHSSWRIIFMKEKLINGEIAVWQKVKRCNFYASPTKIFKTNGKQKS